MGTVSAPVDDDAQDDDDEFEDWRDGVLVVPAPGPERSSARSGTPSDGRPIGSGNSSPLSRVRAPIGAKYST